MSAVMIISKSFSVKVVQKRHVVKWLLRYFSPNQHHRKFNLTAVTNVRIPHLPLSTGGGFAIY
jgi:hypothetical protein